MPSVYPELSRQLPEVSIHLSKSIAARTRYTKKKACEDFVKKALAEFDGLLAVGKAVSNLNYEYRGIVAYTTPYPCRLGCGRQRVTKV